MRTHQNKSFERLRFDSLGFVLLKFSSSFLVELIDVLATFGQLGFEGHSSFLKKVIVFVHFFEWVSSQNSTFHFLLSLWGMLLGFLLKMITNLWIFLLSFYSQIIIFQDTMRSCVITPRFSFPYPNLNSLLNWFSEIPLVSYFFLLLFHLQLS